MCDHPAPSDFARRFCDRVRRAREARGLTQAEMAQALGIRLKTYEKYETRSPLRHHLIEPFAAITGTEVERLFEGCEQPVEAVR